MTIRIEHAAIWTRELERLRDFYVGLLGGHSGPRYENPRTGFCSYFISFGEGARLELMSRPTLPLGVGSEDEPAGYAHVAFRVGSRKAVDELVAHLAAQGVTVLSRPRVTGDGYYEAVIADPDGNRVELAE